MTTDVNLHVEHLTRVEGHGDIILNVKQGRVEKVQWNVTEAPRLFEAFVQGKAYDQVAQIVSRICGICSIGHTIASLKATEAALGVSISDQSRDLRKLALHAENMQSHILHLGYLVVPDLFGVGSVLPLLQTHLEAVKTVIELHRVANQLSDLICGRTTHPVNLVPGGLWKTPSERQLLEARERLVQLENANTKIGELILSKTNNLPDFTRETEYIALKSEEEYALYEGVIGSSDTGTHSVSEYRKIANEFVVPQSTAKYTKHARESYMVGALSRFNLNSEKLSPKAKAWAERLVLKPVNINPFMNNVAQFVEFVHSCEDSISIIDSLIARGLRNEKRPKVKPKAGRGVGAVEVPRGILFHEYAYDDNGVCKEANCIIPTNQNHNNIQKDLEVFAPTLLENSKEEIQLKLEMLVRAYDPCISCSTHLVRVNFKKLN
jgi:coenzyme F420-reducing hydrogenase alpha subunit